MNHGLMSKTLKEHRDRIYEARDLIKELMINSDGMDRGLFDLELESILIASVDGVCEPYRAQIDEIAKYRAQIDEIADKIDELQDDFHYLRND